MRGIFRALVRFGLVTLLGLLLTPHISHAMDRLAQRAPDGSVVNEFLVELRDRLGKSLVAAFGEAVTGLVFR
jgi:hypothetical protein